MKKSTLLTLAALAIGIGANATEPLQRTANLENVQSSAATRASDDLILDPEGNAVTYVKSAYGLYMRYGIQFDGVVDNLTSEVVFGEDNTVYMKDPFTYFEMAAYLEGKLEGNTITFDLPQLIYTQPTESGAMGYYYVNWCERYRYYDEDKEMYLNNYRPVAPEDNKLVMTIDDDGVIKMAPSNREETDGLPMYIYGLCDANGNWMRYGDSDVVLTPFKPDVYRPTGETERWTLASISNSRYVDVAIEGKDVYIGNLFDEFPDTFIKGKISGDKVVFPAGQYLGTYDWLFCYMMPCEQYGYFNDDDVYTILYRKMNQLELAYDAEKKTMEGEYSFCISRSKDKIEYVAVYDQPYFHPTEFDAAPARPATPVVGLQYEYKPIVGYGCFWTQIPTYDINKNLIDPDLMYYNIFIDGEQFVLSKDEYEHLPEEEYVDIPYFMTDNYDVFLSGTRHIIATYFQGGEEIAVESFYVVDGKEYRSDRGICKVGAVDSISAAVTVGTEYFDLQGRKVKNPENGIFIERSVKADGSATVRKLVIK